MLIVGRKWPVSFAEEKVLPSPSRHACKAPVAILERCSLRTHNLRIEARDAIGRAGWHVKLHVRDTNRHGAKALIGSKATNPIAPWTKRLDITVTLVAFKARVGERLANPGQAPRQGFIIGDDYPDVPAQHLRFADRQVKLLTARIDPHVTGTGHHVRVTRK